MNIEVLIQLFYDNRPRSSLASSSTFSLINTYHGPGLFKIFTEANADGASLPTADKTPSSPLEIKTFTVHLFILSSIASLETKLTP